MLSGMRQPSFPTRLTRPIGQSGAAAVIAGAAMGAIVGARVACHLRGGLFGLGGCVPGGAPTGALVGALLALVALPLLGQGTRPGEHAAHRPAPTTTTAARLVWLAIAAALGRWLAEGLLHPQMGLEGVAWMGILPVVLVGAAGLAMAAEGLVRRRGWARWAAVVAFSLLGVTALAGLVDWIAPVDDQATSGPAGTAPTAPTTPEAAMGAPATQATAGAPATPVPAASEPPATQATTDAPATGMLMRSRARGWGPAPIDLVTPVLFLAISVGVILLLMTPATRRDFRSSGQPLAGTNGR
jgi:hypothetical protein